MVDGDITRRMPLHVTLPQKAPPVRCLRTGIEPEVERPPRRAPEVEDLGVDPHRELDGTYLGGHIPRLVAGLRRSLKR